MRWVRSVTVTAWRGTHPTPAAAYREQQAQQPGVEHAPAEAQDEGLQRHQHLLVG